MITFIKNHLLQYESCSDKFLHLSGLESIFGKVESDMAWGRFGGGLCSSSDRRTIEAGEYEFKEILFTTKGWKGFSIKKIFRDNLIEGTMTETEEPAIKILNTFSQEAGFIVPYKDICMDITDINCILWKHLNWHGDQFNSITGITPQAGGKRLEKLRKKFTVKNEQDLLNRLSQLNIIAAANVLDKHNMLNKNQA